MRPKRLEGQRETMLVEISGRLLARNTLLNFVGQAVPLLVRGKQNVIKAGIQARQRVQDIVEIVLGKKGQGSLRAHLARSTAGTFALKVASTGFGFLTSLLLARLLGAAGYGVYAYAMSIVALLVIPATFGLPQLLIRNLASYRTRSEWNLMRGLLRWSNWSVLVASVAIALLMAIAIELMSERFQPQTAATFRIALLSLPLMSLSQIRQTALQGLNHIVEGQLPEALIRPVLFIALVGGAYFFFRWKVSASLAMGMQVIAAGVTFLIGTMILRRHLPAPVKEASPSYEVRAWMRSALPLLFIGGVSVINQYASILILGALKGAADVGIYKVATQMAALIPLMLVVVNTAIGPTISSLYTKGDMNQLQRVVTRSARLALLFSLPVVLAFAVFGKWLLLLFGSEFPRGTVALAILSIGQLVNVAAGSVGLLLIMTGHENDTLRGLVGAAVINVTLSVLLIPICGLEGAAVASAVSTATWNILLTIQVYRNLGIYPSALGFSRRQ